MALLITPTLLNSYNWLRKCPQSWKDRAYNDIMSTLKREPFVTNIAIEKGNNFEKAVYANANSDLDNLQASDFFINVCKRVKGYDFQKSIKLDFEVDDEKYCCFGRIDCYSPKEIIDIKTTSNFKGDSQYLTGWQHLFYTAIPNIPNFTYLVIEWESENNYAIKSVNEVKYIMEDKEKVFNTITDGIRTFIDYLKHDDDMSNAYYTIYNKYDKR